MKSRTITFITILFALMLAGIIVIQAWWIHRSVQLNARQYDASVYRALEGVVKQTEQKEDFTFIHSAIGFDSMVHTVNLHKHTEYVVQRRPKTAACSLVVGLSNNVSVSTVNGMTVVKVESQNGEENAAAENFVFNEDQHAAPQTVEDVHLSEKIQNIDTLVQKMVHIKNPDSISIKPGDIEDFVREQLWQFDLLDTFHFALFKPPARFIYQSEGFTDTVGCYKINLYPNDLFGRNVLLFVDIPGRLARIHAGVWWAYALSLFFIISLFLLFIYSIRMLIRHKNLLASKNDFINHISHEIKTPLAGISLGADMLMEKSSVMSQEQIGKTANAIKEQSTRLHKDMSAVLLNALVDEAPNMKFTEFNLIQTIKNSLLEFSLIFNQKNVMVSEHYVKDQVMINGNEMLWQKVFCNLVDNSIKFSNPALHITISVESKQPGMAEIKFADDGKGINKEDLNLIFDKFYRSDYYKQSNIQGFGLGLNFVKKVVEMHHGKIRAESEQGTGTTIIIEIPTQHD